MPAIICKQISKTFNKASTPVNALSDFDLEVPAQSIFGLAGVNGAGKTTAIRSMLGDSIPDKGQIEILECAPLAVPPWRTGFAPEQADLPDFLTVSETLEYSCALLGKELSAKRANQILADLQLTAYKDEQNHNLSKGNRQRLSLAASIAHEPELLIFDEPASGLDPIGRKLVKDLMKRQKAEGKTIFFTTHILTDLAELCDYIGFIHQGKMVFSGTFDDLFKSSCNDSIEAIFISLISQNSDTSKAEAQ